MTGAKETNMYRSLKHVGMTKSSFNLVADSNSHSTEGANCPQKIVFFSRIQFVVAIGRPFSQAQSRSPEAREHRITGNARLVQDGTKDFGVDDGRFQRLLAAAARSNGSEFSRGGAVRLRFTITVGNGFQH